MLTPLLGHSGIVDRLWASLARGTLHHALLFEGPPGIGKRTVALRLAMAANCLAEPPEARPCGECGPCRQVLAGNHPDVLRLEPDPEKATPTITVEQVREVVRQAGYHRFSGRRRTVLVDPAEAMLPAAANALLKTLEEPPAGTGFVLIANHASALLPTIVSRCQRFRFGPVARAELVPWLSERGHTDEADLLARLSGGCPGHALALADGGLESRRNLREALLGALAGELGGLFAFSEKLCSVGGRQEWMVKVGAMIAVLEDLLRDAVTVAAAGRLDVDRLIDPEAAAVAERWAALWPGGVAACAEAIALARENLDANVSGRTLVDALLVRVRSELGSARHVA